MRISALIVGISEYESQDLNSGASKLLFAAGDAESFKHYVLAGWSDAEHQIIELLTDHDATLDQWFASVGRLRDGRPDLFLVYMAGHAYRANSDAGFYLTDSTAPSNTIKSQDLDQLFTSVGADTSVLLLDCCHAEAVAGPSKFFRSLDGDSARVYLCSARAEQRSWEDSSIEHGFFSNALIRGLASSSPLKDTEGFVNIDQLFSFISQDVAKQAFAKKNRERQEPVRGGIAAASVRLPTVSVESLNEQISTHQALTAGLRRWLARVAVALATLFVVSDLSFQHIDVDAEGAIVAQSGIHIFNPFRRLFSGGVVDTGLKFSDLNQHYGEQSEVFDSLISGTLTTLRLHKSRAWPTLIVPLLSDNKKRVISVLLGQETSDLIQRESAWSSAPPLKSIVAKMALDQSADLETVLQSSTTDTLSTATECTRSIDNYFDYSQLNPSTNELILELDWRLASALSPEHRLAGFSEAMRIVAYRQVINAREYELENTKPDYNATREYSRLAQWTESVDTQTLFSEIKHQGTWCSMAEAFVVALTESREAVKAEEMLVNRLREFSPELTGDLLSNNVKTALDLLGVLARFRPLQQSTVETITDYIVNDDRGLQGVPAFVGWLVSIAQHMLLPDLTQQYLIKALLRPADEHDFTQMIAFEILACNVEYLSDEQRTIVKTWSVTKMKEYGFQEPYINGIACLGLHLPEKSIEFHINSMMARTNAALAVPPPTENWRGDMLISSSGVPEWLAISQMAQSFAVDESVKKGLFVFASVSNKQDIQRTALLAIAFQYEPIRLDDWTVYRQVLARFIADSGKRDLLAEAAGEHICNRANSEITKQIQKVRQLWSTELMPVIKYALGKTVHRAALCSLPRRSEIRM